MAYDAASNFHPRNMSAFSQSFALFTDARKYPKRISNGSRANYDMPASECQQVEAFSDQSTPPFAVLNSGSPSQQTHHYVPCSVTSASYSTSLPCAHLTAGNSLYATPGISVSVMHLPSERGVCGSQELNHSTPLSGECNGPTTSDKPLYPTTTRMAHSPTLISKWQACSSSSLSWSTSHPYDTSM